MSIAFEIFRGDTAPVPLNFVQLESPEDAYNLTGISTLVIAADTAQNPTDETTQLWAVTMSILSPTAGTATFSLNATQADMTPATYWFDVQATLSVGGTLRTLFKGQFRVKQDINK